MKILIINGANLNMLGIREKSLYGEKSYKELVLFIKNCAKELCIKVKIKQSNYEGEIIEYIQRAKGKYDGIVINAGGYTHTSISILDALKAVEIPTVETHLTDIEKREDYRKKSFIAEYAEKRFIGEGFFGYKKAMEYLKDKYGKDKN